MARLSLPPVDPVFGEAGIPGLLAYYYLWHFSAAEIALVTSMSGWEADIGLTWFTAFASLSLMMGLTLWLSKRATAAIWVVALAAAGSLSVTLYSIFHAGSLAPVLLRPIGMAGWLFRHVGAATSDGGVLCRYGHAARHPLRLAANFNFGSDNRRAYRCRL